MMIPPESVWAACPLSSTVHEENRCTVTGCSRCQRHGGACGPAGFQTAGHAIRITPSGCEQFVSRSEELIMDLTEPNARPGDSADHGTQERPWATEIIRGFLDRRVA